MKSALLAIIVLAGNAHAMTTCTDSVKQSSATSGQQTSLLRAHGRRGLDMPLTGEASKVVFALASTSRLTGERITITYAADVN